MQKPSIRSVIKDEENSEEGGSLDRDEDEESESDNEIGEEFKGVKGDSEDVYHESESEWFGFGRSGETVTSAKTAGPASEPSRGETKPGIARSLVQGC